MPNELSIVLIYNLSVISRYQCVDEISFQFLCLLCMGKIRNGNGACRLGPLVARFGKSLNPPGSSLGRIEPRLGSSLIFGCLEKLSPARTHKPIFKKKIKRPQHAALKRQCAATKKMAIGCCLFYSFNFFAKQKLKPKKKRSVILPKPSLSIEIRPSSWLDSPH